MSLFNLKVYLIFKISTCIEILFFLIEIFWSRVKSIHLNASFLSFGTHELNASVWIKEKRLATKKA